MNSNAMTMDVKRYRLLQLRFAIVGYVGGALLIAGGVMGLNVVTLIGVGVAALGVVGVIATGVMMTR